MAAIPQSQEARVIRIGPLRIDREARPVSTADGELVLTALQFDLFPSTMIEIRPSYEYDFHSRP